MHSTVLTIFGISKEISQDADKGPFSIYEERGRKIVKNLIRKTSRPRRKIIATLPELRKVFAPFIQMRICSMKGAHYRLLGKGALKDRFE